ncbi:hypothetical protein [Streptomyces sp. NPDC046925]|uniref:hypothetical protein n=1 Tax=Streptomyces sp. NPDC046925 TaxID=3155375 RepID=UPI0033CDDAA9
MDDVPWQRLESVLGHSAAAQLRQALRDLVLRGRAATEEDCYPLYDCLSRNTGRAAPAATAMLPCVVALAGVPDTGDTRIALVQLLTSCKAAAEADPDRADSGWHEAWRLQRPRIQALLDDPLPAVRREALPLAEGIDALLQRWHAEEDPAVRLPLLLALGTAATDCDQAGYVERVRAVLAGELRTESPVMRVAAVHALAAFDPQAAVRELDLLVEVLSDPGVRGQFETTWYIPDVEGAFTREDVIFWTGHLFQNAPHTALAFVVRLIGAARRTEDALLCRAALDEAWRLLVERPSTASALAPLAGALLADPDAGVRYRAAHLLAVLGSPATAYAEELAALLDDPGQDELLEGTVGDHARWALTRIGDERALPGLVEHLYAPYRGQWSRSYVPSDPRLPEVEDVLIPLRAHADALLPAVRELLRDDGVGGSLTCCFLGVLRAWGPDAAPALPEVVALLDDARYSLDAVDTLVAMGEAARSAESAVRRCTVLDHPGNHHKVAWAAWRLGGDRDTALARIGGALRTGEGPLHGPVGLLGDFGPAAAPYADLVRDVMDQGDSWARLGAAAALWSITGQPQPTASVAEEYLAPIADGGDAYGSFLDALHLLAGIGTISPAARATLRAVRESDRRLSTYRDYRAFARDQEIRSAIDDVLTPP